MNNSHNHLETPPKHILMRLLKYVRKYIGHFIIAFFLLLVIVAINLIQPLLIKNVLEMITNIDPNNPNNQHETLIKIVLIVGITFIMVIIGSIMEYVQSMMIQKDGQKIIYQMREDVFIKIESLSIGQINKTPIGKLVTRVTNDMNGISDFYTNVILNLLKNVITVIAVLAIMAVLSLRLFLCVLMVMPIIIGCSIIFRIFSRKAHRMVRKEISNINASLSENISGMKITQTFNQQEKQYQEFLIKNTALKKSYYKQLYVFGIFRPFVYLTYIGTVILILYVGSREIIDSNYLMSFTVLYSFYLYIEKLFNPIQQLADQFNIIQSAFTAAERIFKVLDTDEEISDTPNAEEIIHLAGKIEFRNVWFAYEDEDWILKDVSFIIHPKQTVAFVGATGSGKTTILGLIVRNYDIQKGQILIDDIDIKDIKISSIRKHIGQMLQDVFLFSGTIASNITLRDETITVDEILRACKFVNADKVIDKLPNGLNEEVRERGNNFSAGERQLLSFARVIVHKPNIMILDEATANIDTETEVLIQDSLNKMMNIGTMLIVAHRLSTIQHADMIIVLHKGVIIESGNHNELLKQGGHYYQLYRLQYQNKKEEEL